MKTLINRLVILATVSLVAQPLLAGPAPGYLETLRTSLKSKTEPTSVAAPVTTADPKAQEKIPATSAPAAAAPAEKPVPRSKLVTSGPPKNMTTHLVNVDAEQETRLTAKK